MISLKVFSPTSNKLWETFLFSCIGQFVHSINILQLTIDLDPEQDVSVFKQICWIGNLNIIYFTEWQGAPMHVSTNLRNHFYWLSVCLIVLLFIQIFVLLIINLQIKSLVLKVPEYIFYKNQVYHFWDVSTIA